MCLRRKKIKETKPDRQTQRKKERKNKRNRKTRKEDMYMYRNDRWSNGCDRKMTNTKKERKKERTKETNRKTRKEDKSTCTEMTAGQMAVTGK